MGFFPDKTPLS